MHTSRETERLPQSYTPTPDGFERRLRAWVRLPADDVPTPDAAEANTPPQEPSARDHAWGGTCTPSARLKRSRT
jgi:hypothetical protein